MNTNHAVLFAAAHSLLVGASMEHLAKIYSIPVADLKSFLANAPPLSWPKRLALALGNLSHRPDLLPLLTLMARLDTQYEEADRLFRRADDFCDEVRDRGVTDVRVLMKADSIALKAHQHRARILRDLQAAERRHEKAQASPDAANTTSRQNPSRTTTNQNSKASAEKTQPNSATSPATSTIEMPQSPPPATNDQPQATSFPTPEEFKELIFKHRHRIKDTPAKERPALISRLIEAERAKNQPAAAA